MNQQLFRSFSVSNCGIQILLWIHNDRNNINNKNEFLQKFDTRELETPEIWPSSDNPAPVLTKTRPTLDNRVVEYWRLSVLKKGTKKSPSFPHRTFIRHLPGDKVFSNKNRAAVAAAAIAPPPPPMIRGPR